MYKVHRVTAANIESTARGYKLYSLQLDSSVWATKLMPVRESERRWDSLYKQYKANNKTLDFLVGKYVAIGLESSKFGMNFREVVSLNVIEDFKKQLDSAKGRGFSTRMNIFAFLEQRGYLVSKDGTITLKEPYSHFALRLRDDCVLCFPKTAEEGTLTPENILPIYDKFFKDQPIDNGDYDCDEQYGLTPAAIVTYRKLFHKHKSGVRSQDTFDVLRLGDRLSQEHQEFLSGTQFSQHEHSPQPSEDA